MTPDLPFSAISAIAVNRGNILLLRICSKPACWMPPIATPQHGTPLETILLVLQRELSTKFGPMHSTSFSLDLPAPTDQTTKVKVFRIIIENATLGPGSTARWFTKEGVFGLIEELELKKDMPNWGITMAVLKEWQAALDGKSSHFPRP